LGWGDDRLTTLVRTSLAGALGAGGLLLIAGAIGVDYVGQSAPGFGTLQRLMVVIGAGLVAAGVTVFAVGDLFVPDLVAGLSKGRTDVLIAGGLLLAGLVTGMFYAHVARGLPPGTLYFSTTAEPHILSRTTLPYGFLLGVTVALAYGIFRLAAGRGLAAALALALMVSPMHLFNLVPSLMRDYIKAPLMLALVLLMGLLVALPMRRAWLFVTAAGAGLILGAGLWFRADLVLFVVPFVPVILFFRPGDMRRAIKANLIALGIFLGLVLVFVAIGFVVAFPTFSSSSASSRNALAGMMVPFDDRLAVTHAAYDWGWLYLDEFSEADAFAQAAAKQPNQTMRHVEVEFPALAARYQLASASVVPADVLTRAGASIFRVLELPFAYAHAPPGADSGAVGWAYAIRGKLVGLLAGSGVVLVIGALLILAAGNVRRAVFAFLFVIYFAGYPALQFQGRHYFHLEFITLWALAFVVQKGWDAIAGLARGRDGRAAVAGPVEGARRAFVFGVAAFAAVVLPLAGLRALQAAQVRDLLASYLSAPAHSLPLSREPLPGGVTRVTSPGYFTEAPTETVTSRLLIAEFSRGTSSFDAVWPTVRYERGTTRDRPAFSRTLEIPLGAGPTKVAFPAIAFNDAACEVSQWMSGIEMPADQASCLRALYVVDDPGRFPVLVTAVLPLPGGPKATLYQRMAAIEVGRSYAAGGGAPDGNAGEQTGPLVHAMLPAAALDPMARVGTYRWVIDGIASPRPRTYVNPAADTSGSSVADASWADRSIAVLETDLIKTVPCRVARGARFVARGTLGCGGVTFALISPAGTGGWVHVTQPGPFTVYLKAPRAGTYQVGVANDLDGYTSLENRAVVDRAQWLPRGAEDRGRVIGMGR
jgi:hypothetical protein